MSDVSCRKVVEFVICTDFLSGNKKCTFNNLKSIQDIYTKSDISQQFERLAFEYILVGGKRCLWIVDLFVNVSFTEELFTVITSTSSGTGSRWLPLLLSALISSNLCCRWDGKSIVGSVPPLRIRCISALFWDRCRSDVWRRLVFIVDKYRFDL